MDLYKSINSSGNTALYPKAAIAFKRVKIWIYIKVSILLETHYYIQKQRLHLSELKCGFIYTRKTKRLWTKVGLIHIFIQVFIYQKNSVNNTVVLKKITTIFILYDILQPHRTYPIHVEYNLSCGAEICK